MLKNKNSKLAALINTGAVKSGLVRTIFSGVAFATASVSFAAENYAKHPRTEEFVKQMVGEFNYEEKAVRKMLSYARKKDNVLKAIARPAEKTKAWYEYRNIFLQEKRIKGGKAFLKKYKEAFDRAEDTYQIPREMIAAIIGVETYYGRQRGSHRVIDALSTLAFDYPKRPLFWRELKQFMLMVKEEGLEFDELKGSYAGAMGYGQFIPSSFRSYAVDFDGDQKKDIWDNPVDAIGSVAYYFKRYGWKPGLPVFQPAEAPKGKVKDWVNDSKKPFRSIAEFKQAGLQTSSNNDQYLATLLRYKNKQGEEYLLGTNNFYVITRYNRSRLYARAVLELSEALKD